METNVFPFRRCAQGKMFREPGATGHRVAHPSQANSICKIPNGAALFLLGGPGGAGLQLRLLSGLWPASDPRPAEQEGLDAPGTNEETPCQLLSEGQEWLRLPPGRVWWRPVPQGPSPLGGARDEPEDLPLLLHRGVLVCCLEHHPPGGILHGTWSAADPPGSLCRAGGGGGRGSPYERGHSSRGLHPEELLPKTLPLPAREEIQPLCLGDRQSRNHEILVFVNSLAEKIKEREMRPVQHGNDSRWLIVSHYPRVLPCQRLSFLHSAVTWMESICPMFSGVLNDIMSTLQALATYQWPCWCLFVYLYIYLFNYL